MSASTKAKDMATNGMMCSNWWGWNCTSFGTFIACPCTWRRMGSMLDGNNTFRIWTGADLYKLVHYEQSIGRMRPSLVRTCCFVSCLATVDHSQISYRNKFDDAVQAKQHAFLQRLETSLASANQLEGFHPQLAWLRGLSAGTSTEFGRTLEDMVGDTGFAGWKLLWGAGSSLRFMHSWGPGIPSGAWRRCGSCSTRAVDLHHRLSRSATFDSQWSCAIWRLCDLQRGFARSCQLCWVATWLC